MNYLLEFQIPVCVFEIQMSVYPRKEGDDPFSYLLQMQTAASMLVPTSCFRSDPSVLGGALWIPRDSSWL